MFFFILYINPSEEGRKTYKYLNTRLNIYDLMKANKYYTVGAVLNLIEKS